MRQGSPKRAKPKSEIPTLICKKQYRMKLFRSHVARTSVFTRLGATDPSPDQFSSSIFPIGFAHYPARTPTAERCLGNNVPNQGQDQGQGQDQDQKWRQRSALQQQMVLAMTLVLNLTLPWLIIFIIVIESKSAFTADQLSRPFSF